MEIEDIFLICYTLYIFPLMKRDIMGRNALFYPKDTHN